MFPLLPPHTTVVVDEGVADAGHRDDSLGSPTVPAAGVDLADEALREVGIHHLMPMVHPVSPLQRLAEGIFLQQVLSVLYTHIKISQVFIDIRKPPNESSASLGGVEAYRLLLLHPYSSARRRSMVFFSATSTARVFLYSAVMPAKTFFSRKKMVPFGHSVP